MINAESFHSRLFIWLQDFLYKVDVYVDLWEEIFRVFEELYKKLHPEINDITINIYNDIAQLIFSNIYSVDEYRLIPFSSKDLNLAKGIYTIQGLTESESTWLKIVNL